MAEITKKISTRIGLRIDTYANWTKSPGKDLVLLNGEVALVSVPTGDTSVTNPPTVLAKVGNGTSTFEELKWLSGPASDVADFFKKDSNGAFWTEANFKNWVKDCVEVSDIDAYSKAQIDAKVTEINKAITDGDAAVVGTAQDTANSDTVIGAKKYADDKISAAITGANLGQYATKEELQSEATARTNEDTALGKRIDDTNTLIGTTKTELQAEIDADVLVETNARKTAIQGIQDQINALDDTYISNDDLDSTVATLNASINGKVAQSAYDTKVAELAKADEDNLAAAKEYTDSVKDAILGDGIKDTFDTLVEIQNWIEGDGVNATELTEAIAAEATTRETADNALGTRIDNLNTAVEGINNHTHDNKDLLDTYTQTEANLADAVSKKHSHANATVLNGIDADDITTWNTVTSKLDKSTYDSKITEITPILNKAHEHANKSELDLIASGDKAKWDAAAGKAHEHSNKDVLDGITSETVAQINTNKTAIDNINTNLANNYVAITETIYLFGGTASDVTDDLNLQQNN